MKILFILLLLVQISIAEATQYYAAPSTAGSANGTSCANAFLIGSAWSSLVAGDTLNLCDGTYTGASSMITPTSGLGGASGNPITVRAENDGSVTIDGSGVRTPLAFNNNSWWVVTGIDFTNSNQNVVEVYSNSTNNIFRRLVAYDAPVAENAILFLNGGSGNTNNLYEDVAGFGNGRKIFEYYNNGTGTVTLRRAWGQFSASTWSSPGGPKMVYSDMYNSRNAIYENLIANWNKSSTSPVEDYGLFSGDQINDAGTHCLNTKILGSIGYIKSTDTASTLSSYGAAHGWYDQNCLEFRHLLMYIEPGAHTGVTPFIADTIDGAYAPRVDSYVTNLTTIATNSASIAGDWTTSNNGSYTSVGAAPNVWNGAGSTGARVCYQYVDGTLTSTPLWPWPMDARIRAAVIASGRSADTMFGGAGNSVTQQMEAIFGAIPAGCRSDGPGGNPRTAASGRNAASARNAASERGAASGRVAVQ